MTLMILSEESCRKSFRLTSNLSEDFKYVFMFRLKLSVIFLSLRPSRSPWIPGQHYRSGKSGILGPEMARAVKYLKITWFSECSHKNVTKSDDKNEFIHFQKRDESWLVFALVSSFISTAKSVSILHRLVSLELLKSKMRRRTHHLAEAIVF